MNGKKFIKIIIVFLVLVIIISIFIVCVRIQKQNNVREYEVRTPLQDKFVISETLISQFPDYSYDVEIFQVTDEGKKSILKLHNADDGIQLEKIEAIYSNSEIKAYSFSNYIFYKHNSNKYYQTLDMIKFAQLEPRKYAYLTPIAIEIMRRSWGYSHYVSEFLIKSNNPDALNIIKQYAVGKFTLEEIENYKHSNFTKEEMQEY